MMSSRKGSRPARHIAPDTGSPRVLVKGAAGLLGRHMANPRPMIVPSKDVRGDRERTLRLAFLPRWHSGKCRQTAAVRTERMCEGEMTEEKPSAHMIVGRKLAVLALVAAAIGLPINNLVDYAIRVVAAICRADPVCVVRETRQSRAARSRGAVAERCHGRDGGSSVSLGLRGWLSQAKRVLGGSSNLPRFPMFT